MSSSLKRKFKLKYSENNEVRTKSKKGFLWLLLGTAGQNALQLISILVLARILTPEDFGVVSIGVAIIAFLRIFSEIGVGPALVHKESISSLDVATANLLALMLGLALSIILYCQARNLSIFFTAKELEGVLKYLAFTLPIISFSVVGQSLLQRNLEFKKIALFTFVSYFISYGVISVCMAIKGYGIWALVSAYCVQALVFLFFLTVSRSTPLSIGFDYTSARGMLAYGFGHSIARFWNYAAGQGDNLVIGKILGSESVGFYGRAYQIMSMPAILFGSVIDKVFFPLMVKMRGDKRAIEELYLSSIFFSLLIFVFFSGYLFVFSKQIVYFLFGEGWDHVNDLIKVMSVGLYFRIGYKFSDCLTMAVGKVYARAVLQFIYAAAVVGFVILGSQWGLIGASIGVVLAIILNYMLMMFLVWRILRFSLFCVFVRHVKIIIIFAVSMFLYLTVSGWVDTNNQLLDFLILSVVYLMCAVVLVFICSTVLKDEINTLKLIINV